MKDRIGNLFIALALLALLTLNFQPSTAFVQGTAFTYQGQLQNNGVPASGTFNLQFTLYTNSAGGVAIAGPVTNSAVNVTNGLFTVLINFGPGVFTGQTNWLQIGVASNGVSSFTPLSPLQQLTPVPYAIFANTASNLLGAVPAAQLTGTIPAANVSGTCGNAVTFDNGADAFDGTFYGQFLGDSFIGGSFTGQFIGNGSGLTDVNISQSSGSIILAQLPAEVVTNNETSVTLDNLTLNGVITANDGISIAGGSLNLPNPVTIYSGGNSLFYSSSTSENFFAGMGAGNPANTSGSYNTANGAGALYSNTSGSYNTANGVDALKYNQSGTENTAIGEYALYSLGYYPEAGGTNNIAVGYYAGSAFEYNESGNIDIGNMGAIGENNTIRIGTPDVQTNTIIAGVINGNGGGLTNLNAAQLSSGVIPWTQLPTVVVTNNETSLTLSGTFSGNGSGLTALNGAQLAVTGSGNVFLSQAGDTTLSGTFNTAAGYNALASDTSGQGNTAWSAAALHLNTIGSFNTAMGQNALYNPTNGSDNTAIGYGALNALANGTNNIGIGYNAGGSLTTGTNNIYIGNAGNGTESAIIRIGTSQTATYLVGNVYTPSGTVESSSDRNAKEDFAAVSPQSVLAKVASLPVTEWNYKTDKAVEHIGPMAQDFHAAFGLNGADDKHISVVDEGGVALAAIQGLNEKVDELKTELNRRDAENAELKQQNDSLAKELSELASAVKSLEQKNGGAE